MAVYVDRMNITRWGKTWTAHMIADTSEELHAMARLIGMKRAWCQKEGTPHEHYDLVESKRKLAVARGAIEADRQQMVAIWDRKRME